MVRFRRPALAGIFVSFLGAASAFAQGQTVTVTTNAPLFLIPDANREPLIVAKEGSVLNVLKLEGDWYNIEFQDPQYGRRVGYIQKKNVKLTSVAPQPVDVSIPVVSTPTQAVETHASERPQPAADGREHVAPASPRSSTSSPAPTISLRDVRRIFIEKMPNDLDQYLSAEVTKQLKSRLVLVLQKDGADAILRGTGEKKDGVGAAITGRYLGLHDNATGSVSLVDKDETVVLWSSEAGDRSLMFGVMARGGPRKVADRLVSDLKKALEKAK